jgi:predicted secreted Zn-dependent protease
MTNAVDKFKLKIKNTARLNRNHVQFSLDEARELEREIRALQERIDKLEVDALQKQALTVDIVGRDF